MTTKPKTNTGSIESELETPTPRMARLTPMAQFSRFFAVAAWLLVTAGVVTPASRDIGDLKALMTSGRQANAVVMGKYTRTVATTTCYIWYEFYYDGSWYPDTTPVTLAQYEATPIQSYFSITYLPSDPTIDRVGKVTQQRIDLQLRNWVIAIGITALVMAIYGIVIERRYQWRLFLLRYGIPVAGTVTGTESRSNGRNSLSYWVLYTYTVDQQQLFERAPVNATFFNSVFFGFEITILYHPGKPREGLPYQAITEAVLLTARDA